MGHPALLATVGARVRARREGRGLSRRQLSELSGVSERFLAQLETGRGNISLGRFADVAEALGTTPARLLDGAGGSARSCHLVALLGLRGAGKSSVGPKLAAELGVSFIEVDRRIEDAAGLGLGEIFELHGEDYYRRLEREALERLLEGNQSAVLATGGSIVNHRDNFGLLKAKARTVWLKARPEDHWNRVVAQGDHRPMAENPQAFAELKMLLADRESLYATADLVVDTTNRNVEGVVRLIMDANG